METGTPALSKVVTMALFTLSCLGLLLLLWLSSGGTIPSRTVLGATYADLAPGSPSASPSAQAVPAGAPLPRDAVAPVGRLSEFPAFVNQTKPTPAALNTSAFACTIAAATVSAAPLLRPGCWVPPPLLGASGPQILHVLAATYPAN